MKLRVALPFPGLLLVTALAAPAEAQLPLPLGNQTLVNVTTDFDQDESAVAIAPGGNLLVVWRDAAFDGDESAVLARRFDFRSGLPLSGEFLVNFSTQGEQRNPSAAIADDGRFVVAWEGPDGTGPVTPGIFAGYFQANGTPVPGAAEFPVNGTIAGVQRRPVVAMQPGGGFLIAWEDRSTAHARIVARIYPANFPGSPPTGEIQINLLPAVADQEQPAATADPISGGWYVAWQGGVSSEVPLVGDPEIVPSILLRRLSSAGSGNAEIPLNSTTSLVPRAHVAIAANRVGEAVAVWEAPDNAARGIWARTIDNGVPNASGELPVNLLADLDEREPTVGVDERGGFVAAWVRAAPALASATESPDGSPIVIKGRKGGGGGGFTLGGLPEPDDEFAINSSGDDFARPRLAHQPRGNFVAVWSGTDTTDPQGRGVFLRRFLDAIFADGFETEDTSRWSAQFPP